MVDLANYTYRAYCERVIDGDTYQLRVDLGFHVAISIKARLRGVNCPEAKTPEGVEATEYVKQLLRPAILFWEDGGPQQLQIQTHKNQHSFDRWLVDIGLFSVGAIVDLADALLVAKHATVWGGH